MYLDYVVDQEDVLTNTKKNVVLAKHSLHKKPIHTTQNAIKFFRSLFEDRTKGMGIQNKVVVVS